VDDEIDKTLEMIKRVMHTFGLTYRYRLSTRDPEKKDTYLGHPETWDRVEAWAVEIMRRNKIDYFDGPGEAAFYAPKMDLMATDALSREWQLSTVQIDFVQPERFNLKYIDSDGSQKTPVMIHRAILGSVERFMMVLIEHFAGAFPVWLSPVQVRVLPITERVLDYAKEVSGELSKSGVRLEVDEGSETLEAKIRNAQIAKIPYMVIVGDREAEQKTITIRTREGKNINWRLMAFVEFILEKIKTKSPDL
jgi:threonyl-tRNA synthetase